MSTQYQEEDATYFDEPLAHEMIKDLVEYDLEHTTINEIIELATDQLYANYMVMPYEEIKQKYTKLFDRQTNISSSKSCQYRLRF